MCTRFVFPVHPDIVMYGNCEISCHELTADFPRACRRQLSWGLQKCGLPWFQQIFVDISPKVQHEQGKIVEHHSRENMTDDKKYDPWNTDLSRSTIDALNYLNNQLSVPPKANTQLQTYTTHT